MFYNDVRFPTVYHWIDSCNFFMLSYQTSGYTRECIRIDEIVEITLHQSDSVEGNTPPPSKCIQPHHVTKCLTQPMLGRDKREIAHSKFTFELKNYKCS